MKINGIEIRGPKKKMSSFGGLALYDQIIKGLPT